MLAIVRESGNGLPSLVIIDEILSGTNSEERISASIRILRYLSERNCLVVAATHDRAIGFALADRYTNMHFSHSVNGQAIEFDYRLKDGIVEEGNAIRLLRYIGFPAEITDGLCGDDRADDTRGPQGRA
jgi:DNA mismatch repair ATPase MutS